MAKTSFFVDFDALELLIATVQDKKYRYSNSIP